MRLIRRQPNSGFLNRMRMFDSCRGITANGADRRKGPWREKGAIPPPGGDSSRAWARTDKPHVGAIVV
jgi:hypothetical protein